LWSPPHCGRRIPGCVASSPRTPEFRARIIDLVRAGRTLLSLSKEFNVTDTTIRAWVRQADLDSGRRSDGLTDEKPELTRLRKENARLREERDILLEKAAAWFAQGSVGTRKKRSDREGGPSRARCHRRLPGPRRLRLGLVVAEYPVCTIAAPAVS